MICEHVYGVRWGPLECDGVLWSAMTPLEYDAT